MFHHEGGELAVEVVEENHVAVAHLVQYRDQVALTVARSFRRLHDGDVGDEAVVADGVVVDIVPHLFYQAVIAHGHIAQGGVVDAGMLEEVLGNLDILLAAAQPDVAVEHDPMEELRLESVFGNLDPVPVFSPAAVLLQCLYLFKGKGTVLHTSFL